MILPPVFVHHTQRRMMCCTVWVSEYVNNIFFEYVFLIHPQFTWKIVIYKKNHFHHQQNNGVHTYVQKCKHTTCIFLFLFISDDFSLKNFSLSLTCIRFILNRMYKMIYFVVNRLLQKNEKNYIWNHWNNFFYSHFVTDFFEGNLFIGSLDFWHFFLNFSL